MLAPLDFLGTGQRQRVRLTLYRLHACLRLSANGKACKERMRSVQPLHRCRRALQHRARPREQVPRRQLRVLGRPTRPREQVLCGELLVLVLVRQTKISAAGAADATWVTANAGALYPSTGVVAAKVAAGAEVLYFNHRNSLYVLLHHRKRIDHQCHLAHRRTRFGGERWHDLNHFHALHQGNRSRPQTRGSLGALTRKGHRRLNGCVGELQLRSLHNCDDWHRRFQNLRQYGCDKTRSLVQEQ